MDRELLSRVASILELPIKQVGWVHLWEISNQVSIDEKVDGLQRPGWTVLATDVHGLPFALFPGPSSHGTWAQHDACGSVRNITAARPECRACPPEQGSRTHRAKAEDLQYFYLVRYRDLLKFGHGDANRVRAHFRTGCVPVQILRARHKDVVTAELTLKRRYRDKLITPVNWNLPHTFGSGTEVVQDDVRIDLGDFLNGINVDDVTERFIEPPQ